MNKISNLLNTLRKEGIEEEILTALTSIAQVYQDEGFFNSYWGSQGSGLLLTTGKHILLLKRSSRVEQPGTWGIPGGAVPKDKNGKHKDTFQSAIDETKEEMGSAPDFKIIGSTVFKDKGFSFITFIGRVSEDAIAFNPILNWESDSYIWATEEEIASLPLHFGIKFTLSQAKEVIFI